MGDYPTNERRSCELCAPGAGGTRVRIQTGSSHTHIHMQTHTHTGDMRIMLSSSIIEFIHYFFLCVYVCTTTGRMFSKLPEEKKDQFELMGRVIQSVHTDGLNETHTHFFTHSQRTDKIQQSEIELLKVFCSASRIYRMVLKDFK